MILERRMMNQTTIECRNESFAITEKAKRRKDIQYVMSLNGKPMTALEIAKALYQLGLIDRVDRNYVSPRLTEMFHDCVVSHAGKKYCSDTGRKVTMFKIREA